MLKVLVVDDDPALRKSINVALSSAADIEVDEAFDGINAIEKVKSNSYNIVILDVDMPRLSGMEALKLIKEHDPSIIILILTAHGSIDDAVQAVKEGAFNYMAKPVRGEELLELVGKARKAHNLISDIAVSAPVLMESGRKIIGHTAQMQKVFNIINRVSKVETPILIRGASGTGKELVARAIHFNSARKDEKFVAVNCSAIPENLFESEFFGHEKGSFTGADARKIGKFQFAEGGTLFLDEIGDLPLMMQVKLLRVTQEKTFTPVGSNREIEANVRIIAATNRPLEKMVAEGAFRDDLFYRLNVIPILLPELKERKNDLDHMVHVFIQKFNKAHSRKIVGLTGEAMNCLKKYDWPGNIRELENVIEHAFIWETGNSLGLPSLPEHVLKAAGVSIPDTHSLEMMPDETAGNEGVAAEGSGGDEEETESSDIIQIGGGPLDFNKHKEAFEKEFIMKALKMFKGRINQTALHANIPKKTLLRKIEKYGINAKEFSQI